MQPFGDTKTDFRPPAVDEDDERAARRTVWFLGVALAVAVIGATLVVSLTALEDDPVPTATAPRPDQVETVTTLPPPAQVGPAPGTEVPGYITARKSALAGVTDERVAVVSLARYSTQAQARTLIGTTPIVALLVAPPGTAPATVTGDLAEWVKTQTEATRTERDEIRKLIPTTDDRAFKKFYEEEVVRLDKALRNFAPDSAMVFGAVVKAPAAALKALGAKAGIRLVDVAEPAAGADPKTVYRGLRPEETAKANEPSMRPA